MDGCMASWTNTYHYTSIRVYQYTNLERKKITSQSKSRNIVTTTVTDKQISLSDLLKSACQTFKNGMKNPTNYPKMKNQIKVECHPHTHTQSES